MTKTNEKSDAVKLKKKAKGVASDVGAKRHRQVIKKRAPVSKSAIQRLARRGGVKRLYRECYSESRDVLKEFLTPIIKDAVTLTEYRKKKTVFLSAVLEALDRNNRKLLFADEKKK